MAVEYNNLLQSKDLRNIQMFRRTDGQRVQSYSAIKVKVSDLILVCLVLVHIYLKNINNKSKPVDLGLKGEGHKDVTLCNVLMHVCTKYYASRPFDV